MTGFAGEWEGGEWEEGGAERGERRTITTAAFVSAVNFSTLTLLAGKSTASLILLTVLSGMMLRRDICTDNCNKTGS